MKKIISLILCILMLSSCFTLMIAADGDTEVSYGVTVKASYPKTPIGYAVGETVTLTVAVSTEYITENSAGNNSVPPIYAFNGVLNYDSFLMKFTEAYINPIFVNAEYRDNPTADKISFTYLCPSSGSQLSGINPGAEFVIAEFKFKTIRDGVADISLSDIIFTDKNANARAIHSLSSPLELVIGSGDTHADGQSLIKVIKKAKNELSLAVMDQYVSNLVYPAFTVSRSAYNALDAAIKAAEEAYSKAEYPEDFMAADLALSEALSAFEEAKIYGRLPDDGSEDEKEPVKVTAEAHENGSIEKGFEEQLVRYGTSATVIAVPDEGYAVEKVVINGKDYPADDVVTVASVTEELHIEFYFAKRSQFTDIPAEAWFREPIEKIVKMGLFAGTSDTEFSPNEPMTRAMLVTVLHRLEGKPSVNTEMKFKDVPAEAWFTEAIAWASANGIVNGYTADTFGTNDGIIRQDMVTILYRYLKFKGLVPAKGTSLDAYTDGYKVSDYAREAMEWANATGIVKGTTATTLSPHDKCTRAQVAAIILRYTENIAG